MEYNNLYFILFLNCIIITNQIVHKWNLENSSVNLFSSVNSTTITEFEKTKNDLYVKLEKVITKLNNSIIYNKLLTVTYEDTEVFYGNVDFEGIESIHRLENKNIICPKGKYHPFYFYDNTFSSYGFEYSNTFQEKGDWELKCYNYNDDYFLVFYLMNGNCQLFYKIISDNLWLNEVLHEEIYDLILSNDDSGNYNFPLFYIVKKSGFITLIKSNIDPRENGVYKNDTSYNYITFTENYTRGCFGYENNYDFYYFTYSNVSDFSCGYQLYIFNADKAKIEEYEIFKYSESPLEFNDDVEIEELKFIKNHRYAYYIIKNKNNLKKYYGIIDIELNAVVFNTDEQFSTFIPYTKHSMLAISSTTAYEICVIKKNGVCIDTDDCNESMNQYKLCIEGNKCAFNCDEKEIYLIREKMCSDSCDRLLYSLNSFNECNFCKNFHEDKPYKIIYGNTCFSDIPEGAEIHDSKLYLLKCKNGYILYDENCVPNCYETCLTCLDYSFDINSQKCLTCKSGYTLFEDNCISAQIETQKEDGITSETNITEYICSNEEIKNGECTEGKMNLNDIDDIKGYLKNIMINDESNSKKIIKTDNVVIQYSTLDEQKGDKEASNIDLGDCEQKLKKENNIPDNVSLIIFKADIKNSDSTATYVQYEVYEPGTMRLLNLDICSDIKITIDTPVNIGNKIEQLYDSLSDSGYNLFDCDDSFYHDICSTYTSSSGTDMLLSDRKKDIFSSSQNISLCQAGCRLILYNSETKKAKCNCNIEESSSLTFMNLNIDSFFEREQIKENFYDTLSNSNFRVLKCYNLIFSSKMLKNIGGLFMTVLSVLFLGFNILSFIIYEKSINYYILNLTNKNTENNKRKTEQIINDITQNVKNTYNIKGKKKLKNSKNNNNFPPKKIIIQKEKISNNEIKKNYNIQKDEIKIKDKFFIYKEVKDDEDYQYNMNKNIIITENINLEKKEELNKENEKEEKIEDIDIDINTLNDQEINDLPYEIAVKIDKRAFLEYYWSLLKKKQLILFTFWPANDYNVYAVKVSLFLISFGLYFTINGFFFSDDTMHKLYIDEGAYNILFQIPQILFSSIISVVFNFLLKKLSLTEKNILEIKQEKDNIKKMEKIKSIKKCLRIKFFLYFSLSIILMLFFWYFISCFCLVYKNTQIVLIKDTLISYALSMVYPFGLNLLPGIFRIPALRAKKRDKKYLYKISQYIALI